MSFLTILGTAAVVSAAIFMELIACLAFPVESGTEWLLLLLLVPLVLAAIPLLLLRACAGDSLFSDTPKGRHWAEFGFAFFATGIIGVPSLEIKGNQDSCMCLCASSERDVNVHLHR